MNIVLLTGYSGVGKTTIGNALSEIYGLKLIKVRELLHVEALNRGYKRIRYWLANEGDEKVIKYSRGLIIAEIQKQEAGDSVIVDDNFDRGLSADIKEYFPDYRVVVVALTIPEIVREMQIAGRLGVSIEQARQEMEILDGFKRGAGIQEVVDHADLTLENIGRHNTTKALHYRVFGKEKSI